MVQEVDIALARTSIPSSLDALDAHCLVRDRAQPGAAYVCVQMWLRSGLISDDYEEMQQRLATAGAHVPQAELAL